MLYVIHRSSFITHHYLFANIAASLSLKIYSEEKNCRNGFLAIYTEGSLSDICFSYVRKVSRFSGIPCF
jgi:hypothetical protein